jgi:hypothetical protein
MLSELHQEKLDTLMREAWYEYRTPAYDRGEFRGAPNKTFRDAFFLGLDYAARLSPGLETADGN